MARVLQFIGRASTWLLAIVLWLLVAFTIYCMLWFAWAAPEEEQNIGGIWFIVAIIVGTPAFFLTRYLFRTRTRNTL